jgi:hypothetical protein
MLIIPCEILSLAGREHGPAIPLTVIRASTQEGPKTNLEQAKRRVATVCSLVFPLLSGCDAN